MGEHTCSGYLPVDCGAVRPTVTVPPDTVVTVWLLFHNSAEATVVQTALEWEGWNILYARFCPPGSVGDCVGEGGHDACDRVVPVEASTWGAIKATY